MTSGTKSSSSDTKFPSLVLFQKMIFIIFHHNLAILLISFYFKVATKDRHPQKPEISIKVKVDDTRRVALYVTINNGVLIKEAF